MSEDPDPHLSNSIVFLIIALVILLVLSAFFSATETAFTSLDKIKIENNATKSKSAKLVYRYIKNYDKILSTVLIGNNAVNIASSTIVTFICVRYFDEIGATIGTIILTVVVLIFCEVSPKTLAKEHPETIAKANIYPFLFFYYVLYPLSYLMSLIQKLITKVTKKKNRPIYTEKEFLIVAKKMNNQKVINDIENDLIKNTLIYGDTKVKDVLVSKKHVAYIAENESVEEISKKYVESNFSRLVVTKNNNLSTAYGFLHQKDFFEFLYKKEDNIHKYIIKDPIVCKPNHKISRLLKKMQSKHQHIVLVKHNNTFVGIVTMEDIIEKLVGPIEDENN